MRHGPSKSLSPDECADLIMVQMVTSRSGTIEYFKTSGPLAQAVGKLNVLETVRRKFIGEPILLPVVHGVPAQGYVAGIKETPVVEAVGHQVGIAKLLPAVSLNMAGGSFALPTPRTGEHTPQIPSPHHHPFPP